jgi:nucleoside-diphosphate-sugar epimerase
LSENTSFGQLVNGGQSRRCLTYIDDALIALELLIGTDGIVNFGNPDNATTIADLGTQSADM